MTGMTGKIARSISPAPTRRLGSYSEEAGTSDIRRGHASGTEGERAVHDLRVFWHKTGPQYWAVMNVNNPHIRQKRANYP